MKCYQTQDCFVKKKKFCRLCSSWFFSNYKLWRTFLQELFCRSEETNAELPLKPAPAQFCFASTGITGVTEGPTPGSQRKIKHQLDVWRSRYAESIPSTGSDLMVSSHDQNCGFLHWRAIASSVFYRLPVECTYFQLIVQVLFQWW